MSRTKNRGNSVFVIKDLAVCEKHEREAYRDTTNFNQAGEDIFFTSYDARARARACV